MTDNGQLVKPKMKINSQFDLHEEVDKFVSKVENPDGWQAQETFGRHQTAQEIRAEKIRTFVFEIGVWLLALFLVALIVFFNWSSIKSFLDLVMGDRDPAPVVLPEPEVTPSNVVTSMWTGTAYQLSEDLGWIRSDLFSDLT